MTDPQTSFRPDPPIVIGLLGGIAAGKSTVAMLLEELGLTRIDADAEARTVATEPGVLARIVERFGPGILDPQGLLDRKELAAIVFADPASRKDLEAITHPAIRARILDQLERALAAGSSVVLDVPLLIEGGLIDRCDETIYVDADEDLRRTRAMARGWSAEEFARREAQQVPLQVKKRRAAIRVRSDRPLQELRKDLLAALKLRQPGASH